MTPFEVDGAMCCFVVLFFKIHLTALFSPFFMSKKPKAKG